MEIMSGFLRKGTGMNEQLETYQNLLDRRGKYNYICLFGAGDAADKYWYQFVLAQGFQISFFSDNSPDKWGKVIVDDIVCISPEELLQYGRDVLCLVSTSPLYVDKIVSQLEDMGLEVIGLDQHWFNIGSVIESYLHIQLPDKICRQGDLGVYDRVVDEKERIAVYTCIVGGYDELRQPRVIDPQCDYFCLSMEKPVNPGAYRWIDITEYIEEDIRGDNTRINRFFKMHPHLFFSDYKYSIYYDGSFEIIKSIAGLVHKIGNCGVALYGEGGYGDLDIYGEAALVVASGRTSGDDKETIIKQISRYIREGFPRNFGSAANGAIVREHGNPVCIKIMETWWHEVQNESRRDQLSFWYSVWKNGQSPQDVGKLGASLRIGAEYILHDHKQNLYRSNFKE